jgi:hypothetical protein
VTSAIRFCTAPDGTRLAWTLTGSGPPLVRVATWLPGGRAGPFEMPQARLSMAPGRGGS